jgi:PEP-CTERM motif
LVQFLLNQWLRRHLKGLGMKIRASVFALFALGVATASPAFAAPLVFSSATATFSQNGIFGDFNAGKTIDSDFSSSNGWAIFAGGEGDPTTSQTLFLGLASPLASGPQTLSFNLYQLYTDNPGHLLGDFSLGYTTDVAPTLLSSQTAFSLTGETSLNGTTFTSPAGGQLIASSSAGIDVYTITASSNAAITGIFLNVINDPTNGLPTGGPGLKSNGNFVLNEFTADATATTDVPEPATWAIMLVGFLGLGFLLRSARRKNAAGIA